MVIWEKLIDDVTFGNPLDWYPDDTLQVTKKTLESSIRVRNKSFRMVNEKYTKTLNSVDRVPMEVIYRLERSLNYMTYHGSLEAYQVDVIRKELKRREKFQNLSTW